MGPEQKLYRKLKAKTPKIIWNRVENLTIPGMPDLLGYNTNKHFFTVELKVTKGKKIRFSPHQIAWHKTHPHKTYIIVRTLGPRSQKHAEVRLYPGSRIAELAARGTELGAWCLGLEPCACYLEQLGA